MDTIQYNATIGPLIKIVGKMAQDFFNVLILYSIVIIIFGVVGNLNFLVTLPKEFGELFTSIITVLDASIGNYNFDVFKKIVLNQQLVLIGDLYIITIVICFNILFLNLIIAILSNTFNMFDTKSKALFLSKILKSRDEMAFDENYGAILLTMTPLNIVTLPFVPYALVKKPSKEMNRMLTILQYSFFIIIIYGMFLIGSILMTPIAYLKSIIIKVQLLMEVNKTKKE